jgi:hypothetical protein
VLCARFADSLWRVCGGELTTKTRRAQREAEDVDSGCACWMVMGGMEGFANWVVVRMAREMKFVVSGSGDD